MIGNALSGNLHICILSSTILTGRSRVHLQILASYAKIINLKIRIHQFFEDLMATEHHGHSRSLKFLLATHSEWIQILRNWTVKIIPLSTENSVTTDEIVCMNFFNYKK